jgi:hypothetical protein
VVTICTTTFKNKWLCILLTQCAHVFHVTLRKTASFFSKPLDGLSNRNTMYSRRGTNWNFIYKGLKIPFKLTYQILTDYCTPRVPKSLKLELISGKREVWLWDAKWEHGSSLQKLRIPTEHELPLMYCPFRKTKPGKCFPTRKSVSVSRRWK